LVISNHNSFRVCLIKLLPYISFEKYINILALEMASPGNQHCANCIGAPSVPILCFPIPERHIISTLQTIQCHFPTGGGVKSNIEFSVYRVPVHATHVRSTAQLSHQNGAPGVTRRHITGANLVRRKCTHWSLSGNW